MTTRRSFLSRVVPLVFRLTRAKQRMSSPERARREIAALQVHPEPHAPSKSIARRVDIELRDVDGWPVYTVTPRMAGTDKRVLYTHGGTWIHEIVSYHWNTIAELVESTGATFVVPIYPLAPRGTAGTVVPVIADLAAQLVAEVGPENVTLIGDSAGGTISLSAAMVLRDRGVPAPAEIVLIAAPIDLRFIDPLIARIDPADPWLALPGIRVAVDHWRGDLPLEDPLVSPAFGSLDGLGHLTVFTGTHDIAHTDALALRNKARRAGHPFTWHRKHPMIHVYPLLPIPEGADARRQIAEIVVSRLGDSAG